MLTRIVAVLPRVVVQTARSARNGSTRSTESDLHWPRPSTCCPRRDERSECRFQKRFNREHSSQTTETRRHRDLMFPCAVVPLWFVSRAFVSRAKESYASVRALFVRGLCRVRAWRGRAGAAVADRPPRRTDRRTDRAR